ncbi:tetratricopeptide repeat protein [Desulfogranum japonicum]|uniref:tetratricopeptide repeat protein n=1 Tax=Desulfogranum japonicum TaxID=231447 RepID=UPI00041164F5|nr:tetratricopeptide repeat protein [Desulfogranum japonicum]
MPIESKSQWKKLLANAHQGDAEAQWEVGFYYDEGLVNQSGQIIVKPKPKKAFRWFLLSAEQGNEGSQLALANALSTGVGTKRDFGKAIFWAKKAVKKGSFAAAHNLGSIYRDLEKPKLSFTWYNKSVQMGDYDSLLEVGLCHLFGYGTKQNFDFARKLALVILRKRVQEQEKMLYTG